VFQSHPTTKQEWVKHSCVPFLPASHTTFPLLLKLFAFFPSLQTKTRSIPREGGDNEIEEGTFAQLPNEVYISHTPND
jgi:hypothetical protein